MRTAVPEITRRVGVREAKVHFALGKGWLCLRGVLSHSLALL